MTITLRRDQMALVDHPHEVMRRWRLPEHADGMTLAYDYPLLNLLLTMFWIFILFAWLMTLFRVLVDIFRSHDMSGVAKGLWLVFVIIMPILGVLIYVIARGTKMTEHAMEDAQARNAAFQSYVQSTAPTTSSSADELARLAQLRDAGTLTPEEFAAAKAKVLAG
jgi:ABC-type multidrug transport system fused ATPase/permease subunit